MMSSYIESFFTQISAVNVTNTFIYLIVLIFFLACILALFFRRSKFINYAATLMTSLGILGTFIGIVIGLLGFDTSNIDGSIPNLLEGLKTAFITSICGLIGAIAFNFLDAIIFQNIKRKDQDNVIEAVTPEHILSCLEAQKDALIGMGTTMEGVHASLSGNEEGSLIGQFKMLRADLSGMAQQTSLLRELTDSVKDFSVAHTSHQEVFENRLFVALQEFADMLSKSATEQIIEALKIVIEDFNKNLTEQFGENFKALDESVKKLVVWQEQYKEQVEVMGEQYQQSVDALVDTRHAVAGIWQECENIPVTMDQLQNVIEINQHQINELHNHLEAFSEVKNAAVNALPTIQEQLNHVGENLVMASTVLQTTLADSGKVFEETILTTHESLNDMANTVTRLSQDTSKEMGQVIKEFGEHCSDIIERSSQQTNELADELNKTLTQSRDTYTKHLTESVEKTGEVVNAQLEQLEKATAQEIKVAMETMGTALVKITERFVTDYENMVRAMERVINNTQR